MNRPPFKITSSILTRVAAIQEIVGELKSISIQTPPVKLRRLNKIQTVHHSLAIEGNSLTAEQITAILEKKRVIGPKREILEVQNALALYDQISKFDPLKESDFCRAHQILMKGLIPDFGTYRKSGVGILKGTKVSHIAPPASQLTRLMQELFYFLKKDKESHLLIKACVFHYELEFIHPFSDGNGRMGRLWQQLILMKHSPIFEFISTESIIHQRQSEYYRVLEKCDRLGDSSLFIEFSLGSVWEALKALENSYEPVRLQSSDRIAAAFIHFGKNTFSRKDYMSLHRGLSTATASRDLKKGCDEGILKRRGDKSNAKYLFN